MKRAFTPHPHRRGRPGFLRSVPAAAWLALALLVGSGASTAQSSPRRLWVPDGAVFASAQLGDTLYIGGWFTRLSPPLGPCVPFSRSTGAPAADFPEIPGLVRAMAPDGHGGWFIAGRFPRVGDVSCDNVAHIRSDLTVSSWTPEVARTILDVNHADPYGNMPLVTAIAVVGDTVYIGGVFDHVNGAPRTRLAAIDGVTGALLPWAPSANGEVRALLPVDGDVYVGGAFDTLNDERHVALGVVDAGTGEIEDWTPRVGGWTPDAPVVNDMVADGGRLFVAGNFYSINGLPRPGLGAVSRTTGALDPWYSTNNVYVNSIALIGDYIYADGARAYHKDTADLRAWDPQPGGGEVYAMAPVGNTLYVGGSFTSIGGQPRNGLAAIDLDTAQATGWDPSLNIDVHALGVGDAMVYAGGDFSWAHGVERSRLAAIDLATGRPTAWNPDAVSGPVRALVATREAVYAGGQFYRVGGELRDAFAAIDPNSGAVLPWNPYFYGAAATYHRYGINTMLIDGRTLYVGGLFQEVSGETKENLAAFDIPTGTLLPWNAAVTGSWPPYDSDVMSLALVDTTLYFGGDFQYVGGQRRSGLAAVSTNTGQATAWNPQVSEVNALVARDGRLFAGGPFTSVNGEPRRQLAQFDLDTGALTSWSPEWTPGGESNVYALAADDTWLYAGGGFPRIVAFDQTTAAAADWSRDLDARDVTPPYVNSFETASITLVSGEAYIGVGFQASGGSPLGWFFATPSALETLPTPVLTASGRAELLPAGVRLTWTDLPARAEAIVYRRTGTGAWNVLGRASADYAGRIEYEDDAAPGPERYAYRLGITVAGGETPAGETWIDVPGLSTTGLVMANPHRANTALEIAFGLASDGPATIEVFDAQGRVVLRQALGTLARGTHQVAVEGAGRLRQGLYFVRLARREGAQVRRLVVTDG